MNILVISDLHICNGDKFGHFGWDTDRFIETLEKVKKENNIEKIILNGDIYELYKYRYDDIKSNKKRLIDYLSGDDFFYIRGNHDIWADHGLDYYQITNSDGKIIHIEHGHNADFMNGTHIGRFINRVGFSILKKLVKVNAILKLYFKLIEHDDQLNRIPKKYNSYKYLNYGLRLLKDYDVVVLGHTHKVEAHKTYYLNNKKRYLNCGSCSLGRFQGIILNTESLKYETIKINEDSLRESRNDNIFKFELPTSA